MLAETAAPRACPTTRSRSRCSTTRASRTSACSSTTCTGCSSGPRCGAGWCSTPSPTSRSRSGSPTSPGYTTLSAALDADAICRRSSAAGRRSRTTPSREHGGRVVKTIGDEVMFVGLPAQVVAASRSRCATRRAADGPAAGAHRARGRAGRRARRRLLRTGRQPREPAHRDRAAPGDDATRPAALRDELRRRRRRSRGRPWARSELRSIGAVEVFALRARAGSVPA